MTRIAKVAATVGGIAVVGVVIWVGLIASRPMHDRWYKYESAQVEMEMLSDVLDQYRRQHGTYPSTAQGLEPLVADELIRKIPTDPWGHAYHYVCPGLHNPRGYDLWSTGGDGREGGSDLDKDVTNWPGA